MSFQPRTPFSRPVDFANPPDFDALGHDEECEIYHDLVALWVKHVLGEWALEPGAVMDDGSECDPMRWAFAVIPENTPEALWPIVARLVEQSP